MGSLQSAPATPTQGAPNRRPAGVLPFFPLCAAESASGMWGEKSTAQSVPEGSEVEAAERALFPPHSSDLGASARTVVLRPG